jgi:hypothetical protein
MGTRLFSEETGVYLSGQNTEGPLCPYVVSGHHSTGCWLLMDRQRQRQRKGKSSLLKLGHSASTALGPSNSRFSSLWTLGLAARAVLTPLGSGWGLLCCWRLQGLWACNELCYLCLSFFSLRLTCHGTWYNSSNKFSLSPLFHFSAAPWLRLKDKPFWRQLILFTSFYFHLLPSLNFTHERKHDTRLSESGLFRLTEWAPVPSIFLQMA